MAAVLEQKEIFKGGSFLIEDRTADEVFTPEDFNEEHRMIAETTRQFVDAEVVPRIDELENKDWKLARELVKQAADLGLIGAGIPEEYGGLGLDQTSGALIVERQEGCKHGAEEHKMGIRGSSTTPLVLADARTPVENVLGEIGKGHKIAFNILNIGRFKLGAMCAGGMKVMNTESVRYANERRQFGKPISSFGAIKSKLGEMAIRTWVGESMIYRTLGMIEP